MHDGEVAVDDGLVRALLDDQLPHLADRPLSRVAAWGTDHVIYRLGDDLSVRLPKIDWAAGQGEKEARWLPALAPRLPVDVPAPLHVGRPDHGYPFRWYVSPWLDGDHPAPTGDLAVELAAFVRALHATDASGGPVPEPGQRGAPFVVAGVTRQRAEQLRHDVAIDVDVDALLALCDDGAAAPPWDGPPTWIHGDLSDGNLLSRDGHLTGVIDWGCLAVGDPAIDLVPAWNLFDAPTAAVYLEALGFTDAATVRRGRAWAVQAAINAIAYYRDTNPVIVARSWRTVDAVLAVASGP